MKANELMIGDWVYMPYGDTSQMCGSYFSNRTDWFERVQPIPLTPEILEKNGFEYYTTDWLKIYKLIANHRTLYISIDEKGIFAGKGNIALLNRYEYIGRGEIDSETICDTNYVHELQRALRCCGLWELAENFKI